MLKIYGTNSCGNIISFTKVKLGSNRDNNTLVGALAETESVWLIFLIFA